MSDQDYGAMVDQAWTLVEANRLDEARAMFTRLCQLDGSNPESWMMLGTLHAECSDFEAAVQCLEKAIALDPDYADAHFNLASVQMKQDQPESARVHCQAAVTRDPEYADAWQLLGVIQGRLGDNSEAVNSCRRAIELNPGNASTHANLGLALWNVDRLQEAVACYKSALQLNPQLVDVWLQLAAVYMHLKMNTDAESCYRKIITIVPTHAEAYRKLGSVLSRLGKSEEAIAALRGGLRFNQNDIGMHLQLGVELQAQRKRGQALLCYQAAAKLDPDNVVAYIGMGSALEEQGKREEALAHYQHALRLDPDNVAAYIGMGSALEEQGKREEALAHYQHALRLDPDNVNFRFHLARIEGKSVPDTVPADYVRRLFDEYAERFDSHLVGKLGYKAPELIHEAVMAVVGPEYGKLDVLDLGCGTGLCAPLFRSVASRLTGVDLSEKMIEVAKSRNLYDDLVTGDITTILEGVEKRHDLIIAADVFIYIGELREVFKGCDRALKNGGLFAFTIEALQVEAATFVLQSSGRYAHGVQYVRSLAISSGLDEISLNSVVLRMEKGKPVNGYVVVLRRPLSAS